MTADQRCDRCVGLTDHRTKDHPTQMRADLVTIWPHVREQVRKRIEGDYR